MRPFETEPPCTVAPAHDWQVIPGTTGAGCGLFRCVACGLYEDSTPMGSHYWREDDDEDDGKRTAE